MVYQCLYTHLRLHTVVLCLKQFHSCFRRLSGIGEALDEKIKVNSAVRECN